MKITHLLRICDSAVNAIGLDEYRPLAITMATLAIKRRRMICDRCDGEAVFAIWEDADRLAASWPCSGCRGTGFTPLRGWRWIRVRRP